VSFGVAKRQLDFVAVKIIDRALELMTGAVEHCHLVAAPQTQHPHSMMRLAPRQHERSHLRFRRR
jgi:hypothetical protein